MVLFCIYDHPRDYPDEFVVREYTIDGRGVAAGRLIVRASTLADARDKLHRQRPGLVRIPRHPDDDDVIVETWV